MVLFYDNIAAIMSIWRLFCTFNPRTQLLPLCTDRAACHLDLFQPECLMAIIDVLHVVNTRETQPNISEYLGVG